MRLENLAELGPDKLESLTDEQLHAILSPFYHVTRPEVAGRASTPKRNEAEQYEMKYIDPKKRAFLEELQAEGEDISYLLRRRKK